jgi:hypothetical protein
VVSSRPQCIADGLFGSVAQDVGNEVVADQSGNHLDFIG